MDPSLMRQVLYRLDIWLFMAFLVVSYVVVLIQNRRVREQPRQKRWLFSRVLLAGVVVFVLLIWGSYIVAPRLAPERSWQPFTSEEGRFTVKFPGTPGEFAGRQDFAGTSCMVYSYVISGGFTGVSYTVSYLDAPTADFEGGPRAVLEGMRNMVVSGARSRLLSSTAVTFAGHPGVEFTYQSPNGIGMVHARLVLSGKRVYLQWAGPLADPQTDLNGVEFFKSFTLNEKTLGPVPGK